ncbi:TetR/AcrR family transcriptional regulator [Aeromicrobium piscarium]|uniref:TetR/AcrR family transcriptional regulator n=1 Tax=Aeromicrobium piscarium TaxID=2590901 RepID=A0A554SDF5_9ACTN|nr:TetR/AcrR family transcriptional regulator [Aeromicrobium piscarium]TSD64365.1 TetR/AcrR family transcriptional regulator [Aeromicrobium piscarium]
MRKSPSPATGTKGVPRAEREAEILDAACREFGEQGYEHGSVARIAAACDISRALVYEYFGSRDGLHERCVRAVGDPLVTAVTAAQTSPDPGIRAQATISAILMELEERRSDWHLIYDPTLPRSAAGYAVAQGYRERLNRLGAEGVRAVNDTRDALDLSLLTHLWYGTVSSTISWWQRHPDESAASLADRWHRLFADGASAPTTG